MAGLKPADLRARRRALGLSQARLAAEIGVATNTVARWERGLQPIGNPVLVRLALDRIEVGQLAGPSEPSERDDVGPVRRHTNLPHALTSFIGRERELAEVCGLLRTGRLLTLVGPGGAGKTRLALEAGRRLLDVFQDGVWLVELAALGQPATLPRAVAEVLGAPDERHREGVDVLVDHIQDRDLLLILDNCEHLVQGCAELAERLLRTCPNLRILSTSREVLGTAGEIAWPVPPLELPRPEGSSLPDEMVNAAAVRLFVDRAGAARSGFVLREEDLPAVVAICVRLDGLPLAIELAAARTAVLTPADIASRLNDRFRLLASSARTAAPRHQTLRATIEWSHDLLNPHERTLFRRLSVFVGNWTLELAEQVCADTPLASSDVLDLLQRLVAKSLVQVVAESSPVMRYRLLETLREYARERLEDSPDLDSVRGRHAAAFVDLARRAAREWHGDQQAEWLDRIDLAHGDLRAALHWLAQSGDVETSYELGAALAAFWHRRGYYRERAALLDRLLDVAPEQRTLGWAKVVAGAGVLSLDLADLPRAQHLFQAALSIARTHGDAMVVVDCLTGLGEVHGRSGDLESAKPLLAEALAVARRANLTRAQISCLDNLGDVAFSEGDFVGARVHLEEALALALREGDIHATASALHTLGRIARHTGAASEARSLYEQSLHLYRTVGDPGGASSCLSLLGTFALSRGDVAAAHAALSESLRIRERVGEPEGITWCLRGLAVVAGEIGQHARAVRLSAAAVRRRQHLRLAPFPEHPAWLEPLLQRARTGLGPEAVQRAWSEGEAMSVARAIQDALSIQLPAAAEPAADSDTHVSRSVLTRREHEVAVLVARGASNRDIADALVISERTAEAHVSNALGKLGLTSRSQLAMWAAQRGLGTPL